MDLRFAYLAILVAVFLKNSECQQQRQFCQSSSFTASGGSIMLRTSEAQSGSYEYSNDNGDCACRLTASGGTSATVMIRSTLTIPQEEKQRGDQDESNCGPYVVMSRSLGPDAMTATHQCPRPRRDNDTATFVFRINADESLTFALVNEKSGDVKSAFNLTFMHGMMELQCGQPNPSTFGCPCTGSAFLAPRSDAKLEDRFVAAIVAVVIFLALCALVFCIYMVLKKRKAKKDQVEGGSIPQKNNVDGSENKAYTGSQKSLDKAQKPEKMPRTLNSNSPEKEDPANTSYVRYNSNDALNLSLQQPSTGNKTPTGLGSIIGTADVRGSTESGIYSSADLIGPDQMYGPNGTPQRPKPGLPPRTPSKEDLDAMYAKPNKTRPSADYYSNVPGEQSPYAHQPAALPGGPARSASQDRLDAMRAASYERLDATQMTQRTPSRDRLDTSRDNAGFSPEQRSSSKHSLSETDV